uniref:Large ribosomal subunit protein uL3m n=1 Tax=Crassostrea virginica TaxID=6565 RepID=A0A8B8EXA9_CRAVI|nr:39S ribosomal protein L3, mitochondrial-like [Crassostrea virginica]
MAGSLCKFSGCLQSILLRDTTCYSRILLNHEQKRYRKRSGKPAPWFVPRTTGKLTYGVTEENVADLKQHVWEDSFKLDSPIRAEFLESKGLTDDKIASQYQQDEQFQWEYNTKRTGVIAIKLGLIPQWTKEGKKALCTVLQVIDNHVIRYTPPQEFQKTQGFHPWFPRNVGSLVVGTLSCSPLLFTKKYNNLFLEAGVAPKRKITRFLVSPECKIAPGTRLRANHFRVDDFVDVSAKTIGHGFQGVVKRWGFKGQSASHRGGKSWRRAGATGGGRSQAGTRRGRKMAGHMGMDWNTQKGLKVLRIDNKYDVLYVKGIVPGPDHCYVRVMDTRLRNHRRDMMKNPPPCPTKSQDSGEEVPCEILSEDLFDFREPSISISVE